MADEKLSMSTEEQIEFVDKLISSLRQDMIDSLEKGALINFDCEKTGLTRYWKANGKPVYEDDGSRKYIIDISFLPLKQA